jgi:hypothetical protein
VTQWQQKDDSARLGHVLVNLRCTEKGRRSKSWSFAIPAGAAVALGSVWLLEAYYKPIRFSHGEAYNKPKWVFVCMDL